MAIQINSLYLRTAGGLLKILQFIFSLVGMIMYLIYNSRDLASSLTPFFIGMLVAVLVSLTLVLFNIFGISEILGPFMNLQTYFHFIWMFYILSYSSILLYLDTSSFDRVSAGIFGILLAISYLVDGLHGFVKFPPMPF